MKYMAKLFFSYSHQDEAVRDELEIHLSLLKRQGVIQTWHDRRIGAGKEFAQEIDKNLDDADVILLLVSPYFLASDYCYDIEMRSALQKHNKGDARVIPVILHPCDWQSSPFGKLLVVPRDGKPVSKYANRHDAFLEVVTAVKNAVEEFGPQSDKQPKQSLGIMAARDQGSPKPRSSNLTIKKSFSEADKDEFLEQSFEYIANYFEGSLSELENRNTSIRTRFKRIDANHFAAIIYRDGNIASECKIWRGGRKAVVGGIVFSHNARADDNSFNELLSVEDDGYTLFLKPMGMAFTRRAVQFLEESLSLKGSAEYFWEILIQPLQ